MPVIDLVDAGIMAAMVVALFAGALSFLSPCVLPIVPPYLAYLSGISCSDLAGGRQRNRVTVASICFVLGLSTIFLLLGFTASALGLLFLEHQVIIGRIAGVVVLVFGLHFLGVFRLAPLDRELRFEAGDRGGSALGSYILGLAFAFGWVPCIGPQLGTILVLASQEQSTARGVLLLGVYALGLGLPFVLVAIFVDRSLSAMKALRAWMPVINRVAGVLLVVVGILLITNQFSTIAFLLLETFPALGAMG